MQINQLRSAFLNYFKSKNHKIMDSSDLVPHGDDSLLFTNAGMVQFKDTFLGAESRDYSATTSQKCLRVGGKHNDLENVGFTTRHQTFFEMLGNFSFGEYFKKEAIHYAWEFLTEELKLPKDKLWVTVHKDDKESEEIWFNEIGIDSKLFSRLGDEDNFWAMGDTGPCGPCSEIFYDYGPSFEGVPPGEGDTGERYVEIWNLVFMEFNKDVDGNLTPLPNKCVDTGMGLERICSVLQKVGSNFEVDVFKNFKEKIQPLFPEPNDQSLNVIADHVRAIFFLMAEQIYPSNEGRGYVVRRLIRRAVRHGYKMGAREPFLFKSLSHYKNFLENDFTNEYKNIELVGEKLKFEEESFFKTLALGIKIFEDNLPTSEKSKLSGEIAFKLHDTYGFPIDLTKTMLEERGFETEDDVFEALMKKQKEGSKQHSMFNVKDLVVDSGLESQFLGYKEDAATGKCLALFDSNGKPQSILEQEGFAIFSTTPFYAESGGQIGDTGVVKNDNTYCLVEDCKKSGDFHIHHIKILDGTISVGESFDLTIDLERREKIMRNHSAAHLLHSALRKTLGDGVEQKGSLVSDEKLRFDFSYERKLSAEQISEIEDLVNEQIENEIATQTRVMSYEDALDTGALAFFGDKYGDNVRVLNIGGDFSVEFCGGTHVKNTSDIGGLVITSESSVSAGVRRVEAITGSNLVKKSKEAISLIDKIEGLLNVPSENVVEKIQDLIKENKKLKANKKSEKSLSSETLSSETFKTKKGEGEAILYKNASIDMLRRQADKALKEDSKSFSILLSDEGDKLSYIVTSTLKDNTAKELIDLVNNSFNGRGGGRNDFAQGGSQEVNDLEKKFEALAEAIKKLI